MNYEFILARLLSGYRDKMQFYYFSLKKIILAP
jgi:hypothetical protein